MVFLVYVCICCISDWRGKREGGGAGVSKRWVYENSRCVELCPVTASWHDYNHNIQGYLAWDHQVKVLVQM